MTKIYNKQNQKEFRIKLRKNMPRGEVMLWNHLKNNKLGYKFRRQHGMGKYIVDFYCPKIKLAIEVDGWTHDDEKKTIYDRNRQLNLEKLGIKVIRYQSYEIFENIGQVVDNIWWWCRELEKEK